MFTVRNSHDTERVSAFRQLCHSTASHVRTFRDAWMTSADDSARLEGLSPQDRQAMFGLIVLSGSQLGRTGILPPQDPEKFLLLMTSRNRKAPQGLFSSANAQHRHEEKTRAFNIIEGTISSIPGFDIDALRKGESQSDEFLSSFRNDYSTMREIAFSVSRVFGTAMATLQAGHEEAFSFGDVYRSFEKSLLHGLHPDRFMALLDQDERAGVTAGPEPH